MPFIPVGKRCSLLAQVSMKPNCDYIRQCRGEFTWRGGVQRGAHPHPTLTRGGGSAKAQRCIYWGLKRDAHLHPTLAKGVQGRCQINLVAFSYTVVYIHTYIHTLFSSLPLGLFSGRLHRVLGCNST